MRKKFIILNLIMSILIFNLAFIAGAVTTVPENDVKQIISADAFTKVFFVEQGSVKVKPSMDAPKGSKEAEQVRKDLSEAIKFIDKSVQTGMITEKTKYELARLLNDYFYDDALILEFLTSNLKADFVTAAEMTSGVSPAIRVAEGIAGYVILVLALATGIADMIWLSSPNIQIKTAGKEGEKPWWVSLEAHIALKKTIESIGQSGSKYRPPILLWIKYRWYVGAGLVVAFLTILTGSFISLMFRIFGTLFGGALRVLGVI